MLGTDQRIEVDLIAIQSNQIVRGWQARTETQNCEPGRIQWCQPHGGADAVITRVMSCAIGWWRACTTGRWRHHAIVLKEALWCARKLKNHVIYAHQHTNFTQFN